MTDSVGPDQQARDSGVRLFAWVTLAIACIFVGGAVFIAWFLTEEKSFPPPAARSIPSAPGPDNTVQRLTRPTEDPPSRASPKTNK